MNWNKDRSVLLSRIFIVIFAVSLLLIDVFGPKIIAWWVDLRMMKAPYIKTEFLISLYTISILAWLCLRQLWKLLANISRGEVFTEENVRLMRAVSWTLAIAAVISFASEPTGRFSSAYSDFRMHPVSASISTYAISRSSA